MGKFGVLIRLLATTILFLGILLSPCESFAQDQAEKDYKFGTVDFTAYWAAFQSFKNQQNPYDLEAIKAATKIDDQRVAPPKEVWNPPILFAFLWPLLNHDYSTSYLLMLAISLLSWIVITLLSWKIFDDNERPTIQLITAALLFYPAFSTLYFGQLSLILALALCLGLLALKNQKDL